MGWGIDFLKKISVYSITFITNVFLSKLSFRNKNEVQDKINDNTNQLNDIKSKLKMFASSNIKDIVPKEYKEDSVSWINAEINSLFEEYNNIYRENILLGLYYEYLEENEKKKE